MSLVIIPGKKADIFEVIGECGVVVGELEVGGKKEKPPYYVLEESYNVD